MKLRIFCLGLLVLMQTGCENSVPDTVKQVVFKESRFSSPITLDMPRDETDSYEKMADKYSGRQRNAFGLLPVGIRTEADKTDKRLLKFLRDQQFIKILNLRLKSKSMERSYEFVGHEPAFRQIIADSGSTSVNVANRMLQSITYKNKYTAKSRGTDISVYAMTFEYVFDNKSTIFPNVDTVFKGEAKAYRDIDTGQWELGDIKLGDDGEREYLRRLAQDSE